MSFSAKCGLILLCCSSIYLLQYAAAQTAPQYVKTALAGAGGSSQIFYTPAPFYDTLPRQLQSIYPHKAFPTAPAGYIKNIYFLGGSNKYWGVLGTIYDVRIRMGYTSRDTFNRINSTTHQYAVDTFITGLTTVFTADSVNEDLIHNYRYWMKFPLKGNGFYYNYDQGRNLVVEFSFGRPWVKNYFSIVDSITSGSALTLLAGYRDSLIVRRHGTPLEYQVGSFNSLDFGFDIGPDKSGIEPAYTAGGPALSIYPNPSAGQFSLRMDAPLQGAVITVRDAVGRQVLRRPCADGARLSEEIDLGDAPKGLYFMELTAEGQRITQRLVVE